MEPFVDTQSLSTTASSSTPHTPSPPMEDPAHVEYGYEPSGQYYLDYQTQNQAMSMPQHIHPQQQQQHQTQTMHQQAPIQSQLMDDSHPSATAGPLYRRASFPFVHHDHPMSHYPKFPPPDSFVQEHHHHQQQTPHPQHHHHHMTQEQPYELEDSIKLEHASAMVVPTQIPQTSHQHPQPFYRPASSSSSMSSISPSPVYLNAGLSSIPVMHTDDAASKETQYLRRKCFNCGTTEPPSWRRSTLNPGKIVCNKCGLYERTHNKPRPHQFGLRPGNKARKQPSHPQLSQSGRLQGHSPTSSPKRHGLSLKKEPLDYSYAMRRGSIASINSGSGTSDWDDHSGYSTASSAYMGMAPPPQHPTLGNYPSQSHVPSHHGHHPYNNALSMPPPRSMSSGIRLPQAPPMKVPTKAGSSSPVTSANIVPGGPNSSNPAGNAVLTGSPENMHLPAPGLGGSVPSQQQSPYGSSPSSTVPPTTLNSAVAQTLYSGGPIRGPQPPPVLPSPDYYARRGSTSQIPHHHASPYQHDHHLAMMRRGSVGAIGMGMSPTTTTSLGFGRGMMQPKTTPTPPLPSHLAAWQQTQSTLLPLAEMGPSGAGNGSSSAGSTPGQRYGATDLTPSPPQPTAHMMAPVTMLSGAGSTSSSPIGGPGLHPDLASLTA